jgi:hypothetical protein
MLCMSFVVPNDRSYGQRYGFMSVCFAMLDRFKTIAGDRQKWLCRVRIPTGKASPFSRRGRV